MDIPGRHFTLLNFIIHNSVFYFISWIRENKKKKLTLKQKRIERGEEISDSEDEEDDMEFDGGLTIPGNIWTKLYRYTCL